MVERNLLLAAVAAAIVAAAPAAGGRAGGDPFGDLPLAAPGQLSGQIRYLAGSRGCELREYQLSTGADVHLADLDVCGWPVVSPSGDAVASRRFDNRVELERLDGRRYVLGAVRRGRAPGNFVSPPLFSPDGRRLAYCAYTKTRMQSVVVDTSTGATTTRVAGSCEVAFTARGIAYISGTRLVVGKQTVFRFGGGTTANMTRRIRPQGNPLVASPAGTLLALATRRLVRGVPGDVVTVHVLRLDGHEIARYRVASDITVAFQALAPSATSAVVWWGDILQLATFGRPRDSITFRYTLAPHSGDGERAIFPTAYSPDGLYAVMPRQPFAPFGEPPPPRLPALILDARTLDPRFRLAIDAQRAVWVR